MDKEFIKKNALADKVNDVFNIGDNSTITAEDNDIVDGTAYSYSVVPPSVDDAFGHRVDVRGGTFLGGPANDEIYDTRTFFEGEEADLFGGGKRYETADALDSKPTTLTALLRESSSGIAPSALRGSIKYPNVRYDIDKTSLFINNTTSAADIRQRNVGDCYFLAAILSIIQKDPKFFTRKMSLNNNTVSTTFYHQMGTIFNRRWTPVVVNTPYGIAHRNGEKIGSDYRISEDYKSKWYAKFENTVLSVNQDNYYQAALWVNCIEQAFTVFAANYGKYGKGKDWFDSNERYERITGGFEGDCLHVFYGDNASDKDMTNLAEPSDRRNILDDNKSILRNLLKFKQSLNDTQNNVHMFASTTSDQALERVQYHSKRALDEFNTRFDAIKSSSADDDKAMVPELIKAKNCLERIERCSRDYNASPRTGFIFTRNNPLYREGETQKMYKERMNNEMNEAVKELSLNPTFQNLNLSSYYDLKVTVAGQVQIKRQNITILTGHAYNIEDVDFVDINGQSLNNKTVNDVISNADIELSTVTLENPHGTTKMVYNGEQEEKLASGRFNMKLHEFLVGVGRVQMATSTNS